MRRYSNFGSRGQLVQRLVGLPLRDETDEVERVVVPARVRAALSGSDRDRLAEAYVSGATIDELSRRFGINRGTVSKILAGRGVDRRYHQSLVVDMRRAAELSAAGLNVAETAAVLGVGRTTLIRARKRAREALLSAGAVGDPGGQAGGG